LNKKFFSGVSGKKFMYSFSITVVSVLLVAVAVFAGINALMRPPVIPTYVEVELQSPGGSSGSLGSNPSGNTGGNSPPTVTTLMERKPYFFTFLLFGIDDGNNADVIIVGALDTTSQNAYIISIPRDTRVEVERRLRKPVAAYSVGRGGGRGHDGGVAQMKADVQTLIGFRPDIYISVEYEAFVRMVDAVNGVEVYVPFHKRYEDPTQNLSINISAGRQVLDGAQALNFARFRMASPGFRAITDYQRIENQHQIIRALFDELLSPRTILRIPEFISIYRTYVNTNLAYGEKLWFADQLAGMRGATISTYTLPMRGTSGAPGWYELPDRDEILELINRTINPFTREITAEMVRIAV